MSEQQPPSTAILWVGSDDDELAIARELAGRMTAVHDVPDVDAALASPPAAFRDRSPAAIVLASPTPVAWTTESCTSLARRWPLAPLVSVASSLVEGRRRSGPPLPGVEEVPWHEFAGRLTWWLHDRRQGVPGGLGQAPTARREERILEASTCVARHAAALRSVSVSVAATRPVDLDGVADVLTAIGIAVRHRVRGRPTLDDSAAAIVWDVCSTTSADLTWLALLAAHRPGRAVVLLDSFPRADTARAALRAGATAMLGRPVSVESLSGILLGLAAPLPRPVPPAAVCD